MILEGLNGHFKPNWRNLRIAISRKVHIRSTENLEGNFRCTNGLSGWSSITKLYFKMAAAVILVFWTNSNNSAANWRKWMKFCSNVNGCRRKWTIWPKQTKIINWRWRPPPFWISFIAHNSFTIAHICTKFGKCITFEVLHTCMPKYWTNIKSKMAAVAILDFCTNSNYSAADWHRWVKFCSYVDGCHQK